MQVYQSKTDLQLVHLLKQSDKAAFAEIYNRYAEALSGFAVYKLYRLEDAKDIIHDLFVKLWEDRITLQISGELKTYLYAAIRYRIIDHIRKNTIREYYASMMQSLLIPNQFDAHKKLEGKELQQRINQSLNELSPKIKEIYYWSRMEQLSITEIASKLQLSEQTVKNQLTTALRHLRKSLAKLPIPIICFWWLH